MATNRVQFDGTVDRIETDGFGVIRFDKPIGANTCTIISSSTGSVTPADTAFVISTLRPGIRVHGIATTSSQHDLPKIVELYVSNKKLIP